MAVYFQLDGQQIADALEAIGWQSSSGGSASVTYGSTEPTNPTDGEFWFDTNVEQLKMSSGGSWIDISLSQTEIQNINDTLNAVSNLQNISAEATTLTAGSSATATYANGVISLGLPIGDTGDTGATGATGNGISSIGFLSTTDASGLAGKSGATDTYRITYTDATTFDFSVYNGIDSAVASVAGRTGDVVISEADITDLDKYTKAEVDTALSTKEPADATILKEADIGTKVLAPNGDASQLKNLPSSGTTLLFEKALFGGI